MSYTEIQPLLEKLKQLDEVTILELLDINAEDLIDAFCDRILDNQAKIYTQYAEE
jgi:hypothetical protein